MKRCPECRRDYYDDSLLYCLDDGSALLEGPASASRAAEPSTAILHETAPPNEAATKAQIHTKNMPGFASRSQAQTLKSGETEFALRGSGVARERRVGSARWLSLGAAVILVSFACVYFLFLRTPQKGLTGSVRDVNSPAYDQYLRGKLDSDSENPERNANAIRILEDVVATDPSFAPAYAELARAYSISANYFAPESGKKKLYEDAKLAVEKSLALDPKLAEGHYIRGLVIWTPADHFPHEQAISSLKRAIDLDPSLEAAHHQLGVVYYHIGLLDRGQEEIEKAIAIDPTNQMARLRLGLINSYRTDYAKALSIFKTVPTEANPAIVQRSMATVMFQLGRIEEASKIVDNFLANYSDEGGNVTSVKAMILAKAGRAGEAEEDIQRAIKIGQGYQHFHHTTYNIASAYAILGKNDEAMKWLQFTADNGFPCYPMFEKDVSLDGLRHDPNFISFMEKQKQQWEQYQSTL